MPISWEVILQCQNEAIFFGGRWWNSQQVTDVNLREIILRIEVEVWLCWTTVCCGRFFASRICFWEVICSKSIFEFKKIRDNPFNLQREESSTLFCLPWANAYFGNVRRPLFVPRLVEAVDVDSDYLRVLIKIRCYRLAECTFDDQDNASIGWSIGDVTFPIVYRFEKLQPAVDLAKLLFGSNATGSVIQPCKRRPSNVDRLTHILCQWCLFSASI